MRSHGWFQTAPFGWDEAAGVLTRTERLDGAAVRIAVVAAPGGVEARTDRPLAPAAARELRRRLARMLQLRVDLSGFPAALAFDPELAADVAAYGAGRVLAGASLYEDVVKGIAGTNTTWSQAVVAINRVAALGEDGAWPEPEALLAAGPDRLRAEARVGYRAPFMVAAARAAAEGELAALDAAAPSLAGDELMARLRALPGVGPATAAFLCLLLGRFDRPSVDAAAVRNTAGRWFGGRRPAPREVLDAVAPAGEFAGLALYWATVRTWQRDTGLEPLPAPAPARPRPPRPAARASAPRRRPR